MGETYQTSDGFFPAEQVGTDADGREIYRAVANGQPNFWFRPVAEGWLRLRESDLVDTGSFRIDLQKIGWVRLIEDTASGQPGVCVCMHRSPYEKYHVFGAEARKVLDYWSARGLRLSSADEIRAAELSRLAAGQPLNGPECRT
jgi:hypothetical protein